jgi:hypothetical protein
MRYSIRTIGEPIGQCVSSPRAAWTIAYRQARTADDRLVVLTQSRPDGLPRRVHTVGPCGLVRAWFSGWTRAALMALEDSQGEHMPNGHAQGNGTMAYRKRIVYPFSVSLSWRIECPH